MSDRITVRLPPGVAEAFSRYRNQEGDRFRSQQDVVRHILQEWLTAEGHMRDESGNCLTRTDRAPD